VAYESRTADPSCQICCAMFLLLLAVPRRWQAAVQVGTKRACISLNKACHRSMEWDLRDQILLCAALILCAAVLPWRETSAATTKRRRNSLNKVLHLIFLCNNPSTHLPPPAHGGSSESDGGAAFSVRWKKIESRWRISLWSKILFFSSSLRGGVEDGRPSSFLRRGRRRRWSSGTKSRAPLSATSDCLPTQLAARRPYLASYLCSDVSPTTMRRPSPEVEMAVGRSPFSCIIGGGRGPDCLAQFICRVFVVKSRDLSANCSFYEILAVIVPAPLEN
jgi:hypothetical protein